LHRINKIAKLDDVEDLTNTVFLAFAEQYHNIKNISYWLRRVIFLTYIVYYRKNKLRSSLIKTDSGDGSGKRRPAANILYMNTMKVLALLGEEKQKIITLKLWADINYYLIAKNIRKSESEVMKIFVRTLLTIKNRLG